jgi:hypothetical protein
LTKHDLYRSFRLLHGWLSAFAFIALCFFSFTGLLLNHPNSLSGSPAHVAKQKFTLAEDEIKQLSASKEPAQTLVKFSATRIALKGEISEDDAEGSVVGNEVYVRMRGVRGTSFLHANLRSGLVEITIESSSTLSTLNELHRAERAGASWRLAVDIIAIIFMAMSLIGYLIFLSMRGSRLRTAILITLGSTLGICVLFVFAVS